MALSNAVSSVLQFLHAGYPEGIPQQDYIPLLALLRRRLTVDEVGEVAQSLVDADDTDSKTAMHEAITAITHDDPRAEDIARVRAHLASGGWPLAGLDDWDTNDAVAR
jgi:hypothetical protein